MCRRRVRGIREMYTKFWSVNRQRWPHERLRCIREDNKETDFCYGTGFNWRWLSSGILRRVVYQKFTNVSEVLAASIVGKLLPDYTEQHPRRQRHLHTCCRENLKSHRDLTGPGYGPMAGFCKNCDEPSGPITWGQFVDQLSDHKLIKKDPAP
jgi:hypothetical protein